MWSEAGALSGDWLAARPPRRYVSDPMPIDNETLIRGQHVIADGGAAGTRLNAFFAIPENNPTPGMVNFCRRVGAARMLVAPGVIRSAAPLPRRAAVRMKVGADARL
jgi:hypothetical protein